MTKDSKGRAADARCATSRQSPGSASPSITITRRIGYVAFSVLFAMAVSSVVSNDFLGDFLLLCSAITCGIMIRKTVF